MPLVFKEVMKSIFCQFLKSSQTSISAKFGGDLRMFLISIITYKNESYEKSECYGELTIKCASREICENPPK